MKSIDAVYSRAGFGGRTVRGRRPAVVVVDLSRGFTDAAWPTGSDLSAVVESTAGLIETARQAGAPVVFTTIAFDDADVMGGCAWLRKAPGLGVLRAGTELVEIDPRLPRRPDDPVIVKKGASAFFATTLASVLTSLGVDTVVICGATTSGCIRATAVDAVQSGFAVLVVRECVGDRAEGPHEANLFDIDAKYGDVVTLTDATSYIAGTGRDDEVVA